MPYNRMFALIYAGTFWDKVCHDGRVATKNGYPKEINRVKLTPGLPFSEIGKINHENDCTHFVSCCVGNGRGKLKVGNREVVFHGGGLPIASPLRNHGVYGQFNVAKGVQALIRNGARIVGTQFIVTGYDTTRAAILKHLTPGDVLAYATQPDPDHYEHMCILVGPTMIACHTAYRFGKDYTDVYHPWLTLLRLP
jgi:hypothetical protein